MLTNVNILQLQGTGDDEKAWEIAAVCADYRDAVDKLAEINAEYKDEWDYEEGFFVLNENARIETHDVVDNNWGM